MYGLPGDVSPRHVWFDPARDVEGLQSGRLRFRVRAEVGLSDALLAFRDGREVTGYPMASLPVDEPVRVWTVEVEPWPHPVRYSFAFRNEAGRPVYLVPKGISNAVERLDRWELAPGTPTPVVVPEWSKGVFIYQIFPDRFAKGDPGIDPPDVAEWGSPPHSRQFQGGDLIGVRERLPYLADLGVGMIYLNPIFTSPSNHRYDAVDYYQVDPLLGGNEALAALVEDAHAAGIRVVVDASFNHVHPRFFAFADLMERGRRSPYRDWFRVHEWPLAVKYRPTSARGTRWVGEWVPVWERETGIPVVEADDEGPPIEPTYEAWYGVPTMPRLDLSNAETRDYILDVARFWVREYGIDGWRMDVARYVDPDFWPAFRQAVKGVNPDAYLIAEIMGDASAWVGESGFDATMNYSFRDIALRFLARDEADGSTTERAIARMLEMYPWPVTLANQNLLGSHDTSRFRTVAGGDIWRLRLATVLQFTLPGAPGVYYGDEVGLEGGHDPGPRGAFPWDSDPGSHPIHRTIKDLASLRRANTALVRGDWNPLGSGGQHIVFERRLARRRAIAAINRGSRPVRVTLPRKVEVRWGDGSVSGRELTVAGRGAVVAW